MLFYEIDREGNKCNKCAYDFNFLAIIDYIVFVTHKALKCCTMRKFTLLAVQWGRTGRLSIIFSKLHMQLKAQIWIESRCSEE